MLYISHTFSNTKAKKPWFNSACSRVAKDRKEAQRQYGSYPSAEIHALDISNLNHAKSIHQLTKNSFINRKCQNLSNFNSYRDFWHLANNISNNFTSSFCPPLLQSDGSAAISSFFKAEFSAQTNAINSTLDDTGHIPPSGYFIP